MKVRQKLAMLLAAAMTLTAIPAMTFANSDNRMTREVLKVEKDTVFTDRATAGGVSIVFKDAYGAGTLQTETFYLELTNSKWEKVDVAGVDRLSENGTAVTDVTVWGGADHPADITVISDTVAKVIITPANRTDVYVFPLLVKATGGDATVAIARQGSGTTVTEGKWAFATTGEKMATFKVGDVPNIYTTGKLAPVTFTEVFKGSVGDNELEVTYEVQDADFEFDFAGQTGVTATTGPDSDYDYYTLAASEFVKYSYGFGAATTAPVAVRVDEDDKGTAIFTFDPGVATPDSLGSMELKNVPVRSKVKDPETGDFLVDISAKNDELVDAKDDVKLAVVTKYSTVVVMKDEKPVVIEAGHNEEIVFTVKELIDDSMVGDREFEITLVDELAYFLPKKGDNVYSFIDDQSEYYVNPSDTTKTKLVKSAKVSADDRNVIIVTLNPKAQINKENDFVKFKIKAHVPIDKKDKGEVKIKVAGRALENESETTAITIKNPINFLKEQFTVKVGLQSQVGGKISLTETEKGMFNKGKIKFDITDRDDRTISGLTFYKEAKIDVTGNLQKADLDDLTKAGNVVINVKRVSKEASTIAVSEFDVTVDRTVPQGSYDLKVYGDSIDTDGNSYTVEDFFVVGTPNTEEISGNGLRKGVAQFVIGSTKYLSIGKEFEMDAAAYIQAPGYTMIPVRFVAEAFGITTNDILFDSGVITIFAGERTIQLKSGSNVAVVNGASIKMDTAVIIKDGRTYAPIGEVSKLLGIDKAWDASTQTATFTNK